MSGQDLLRKVQIVIALWRTRRYDQIAAGGAVAGAGAFVWILTGKTPVPITGPYRLMVLIALGAFSAACFLFLVIRAWRIQDPDANAAAMQALPSAVRGPLPFTEQDGELFRKLGRDFLIAQALAYITNDQIPVIQVSGESGVGKTSLLRAGLTGPLKDNFGRGVIYWEAKPTNAWESLTATIRNGLGDPGITSVDDLFQRKLGSRPVIIIDQLEQLSRSNGAHVPIYELIARVAQASAPHPATWIVAFRRDFVGLFEFLAEKGIAVPFISVPPFSGEQAEQVMATLADKAGVRFERQLLKDFTASASINGSVSSVDIGIGTLVLVNLAKRSTPEKETITLDDYKFAGGSSGVLTSYVNDQLSMYPDIWRQDILKALLSLMDLGKNQRIAEGRSASTLASEATIPAGRLAVILETLAAPHIRILEKLDGPEGDPVFRLPHERFIQPIRTLAGSMLAKENLAQVVLDSGYSAWLRSRDARMLLSGRELKQVLQLVAQRAGALSSDVLDYVQRSRRRARVNVIRRVAAGIVVVLVLAALTIRVQWVPQVLADTRAHKVGTVMPTGFPEIEVVMTANTINLDFKQRDPLIWNGQNGKLLRAVPGIVRATCVDPPLILLTDPGSGRASLFDVKKLELKQLNLSIPDFDTVTFVSSCEYFGYVHIEKGSFLDPHRIGTLHFWQTRTGVPVPAPGTYIAPNIFSSHPNVDPAKSHLILTKDYEHPDGRLRLWNLASNTPFAEISRHHGDTVYAVDDTHALVAVAEANEDDETTDIELWNLNTGAFLQAVSVEGNVRLLFFSAGGSLLYFLAGGNRLYLLETKDLKLSPLMEAKPEAKNGMNAFGISYFQAGSDVIMLNHSSPRLWRIRDLDMNSIQGYEIDEKANVAMVLKTDGTLLACHNSLPCKPVGSGISAVGGMSDQKVYVVSKQDTSVSILDYSGRPYVKGLRGPFGDAIFDYNPQCSEVFLWSPSGELIRYREKWTIFGYPLANVHMGCEK